MAKKKDIKEELAQVAEYLRDPFHMRMAVAGLTLAIMVFAVSNPLHGHMKREKKELDRLKTTVRAAEELQLLQTHLESIEPRVIQGNSNDVIVSHLIETIRKQPVDLMRIDAEAPTRHGPMQCVRISIEALGKTDELIGLLHVLETDPHMVRVETVVINPPEKDRTTPSMAITLRMLKDKS